MPEFLASNIECFQKGLCVSFFLRTMTTRLYLHFPSRRWMRDHLGQVYVARLQNENHPLHIILPKLEEVQYDYHLKSGAWPVLRRSLARANHVSVKVGEGEGRGGGGGGGEVQQVESLRPVFLNYACRSYHFSFFENNTKRESIFWLSFLTFIFIGWSVLRFKNPENIKESSSA